MKHTPGPWKLCARGDYSDFDGDSAVITGEGDSVRIAVVHHAGTAEDQANANLIAAAPTMLAALLSFVEDVEAFDDGPGSVTSVKSDWPMLHETYLKAKAAVAKAEGRA